MGIKSASANRIDSRRMKSTLSTDLGGGGTDPLAHAAAGERGKYENQSGIFKKPLP